MASACSLICITSRLGEHVKAIGRRCSYGLIAHLSDQSTIHRSSDESVRNVMGQRHSDGIVIAVDSGQILRLGQAIPDQKLMGLMSQAPVEIRHHPPEVKPLLQGRVPFSGQPFHLPSDPHDQTRIGGKFLTDDRMVVWRESGKHTYHAIDSVIDPGLGVQKPFLDAGMSLIRFQQVISRRPEPKCHIAIDVG